MTERIRELSYEERARWGDCPVCKAKDGEPCSRNVGIPLGLNVNGEVPEGAAHMGRLQNAPARVKEIPA